MDHEESVDEKEQNKKTTWFYYSGNNTVYRSPVKFQPPWTSSMWHAELEWFNTMSETFEPLTGEDRDEVLYKELYMGGVAIDRNEFWGQFLEKK